MHLWDCVPPANDVGYRAHGRQEDVVIKSCKEAASMADELEKERWTRRGFLGASSAALAAGVMTANNAAAQIQDSAQKAQGDRRRSEPVQKNPALDAQNADSVNPPPTDAGGVPTFKYPFSIAHKR